MIQRAAKTNFGGAWVFPGGKLDQEDYQESLYDKCGGLNDQKASEILGIESSGLGYWVACIRVDAARVARVRNLRVPIISPAGSPRVRRLEKTAAIAHGEHSVIGAATVRQEESHLVCLNCN